MLWSIEDSAGEDIAAFLEFIQIEVLAHSKHETVDSTHYV